MSNFKPLEEIVRERPDLRPEVEDFANFLWTQRASKIRDQSGQGPKDFPFNKLEGCLKHLTSSEHEIGELKKIWEPK